MTRDCYIHSCHPSALPVPADSWCPYCVEDWEHRPSVDTMTQLQKEGEFLRWCGPLNIPFDKIHQRIEELFGRPVFVHEFGSPEFLIAEIRGEKEPPTMQELIEDKVVVIYV